MTRSRLTAYLAVPRCSRNSGIHSRNRQRHSSRHGENFQYREPATHIRDDTDDRRTYRQHCTSQIPLRLCIESVVIPYPKKYSKGGDDAHFTDDELGAFGIFDGVGGWEHDGIDTSKYSRELAALTYRYVKRQGIRHVEEALDMAERNTTQIGSSTACVLRLLRGYFQGVNVGDSGFIVVRGGNIVFQTDPQQRRFNEPYQLGTGSRDRVSDGNFFRFMGQRGDIIVAASDGLWDNVEKRDVARYAVREFEQSSRSHCRHRLRDAAKFLANRAKSLSRKTGWSSPFAREALRNGEWHDGGKEDDITIVVAMVRAGNSHA